LIHHSRKAGTYKVGDWKQPNGTTNAQTIERVGKGCRNPENAKGEQTSMRERLIVMKESRKKAERLRKKRIQSRLLKRKHAKKGSQDGNS